MKQRVIEPIKANKDKEFKMDLKKKMRAMTRGLGQVVNTRESIIRVVRPAPSPAVLWALLC